MFSNPQAFLTFKKGASINRTLVNNNFKDKTKTGMQLRSEKIIRMFDLHEKNGKILKRLAVELEVMKNVNFTQYRQFKKELNRVLTKQKEGATPDEMAQFICHLPDSFLPDEKDYEIAKINRVS